MNKRLLLTAPNVNGPGWYEYSLLTLEEALDWLHQERFTCDIRLKKFTMALHTITGMSIFPNLVGGPPLKVENGDEALIFEVERTSDYRSLFDMETDYILTHYRFGLFRKYEVPFGEQAADLSLLPSHESVNDAAGVDTSEAGAMDDEQMWTDEEKTTNSRRRHHSKQRQQKWSMV